MQFLIGLALIIFLGWLAVKLVIWLAPKLLTGVIITLGAGSVVGVFVGIYYGIANYFRSIRENISYTPLKILMLIITILSSLIFVTGSAYTLVVGGKNIIEREISEKIESHKSNGVRIALQGSYETAIGEFSLAIEEMKQYDNNLLITLNNLQAQVEPEKLIERMQKNNKTLGLLYKMRGMTYLAKIAGKTSMVGDDFIVVAPTTPKKIPPETLSQAISDLSSAIILDPKNAYYYHERSRAYLWRNDYDKAIEDLQSVLYISPQFPGAMQELTQTMVLKSKQKPARRN